MDSPFRPRRPNRTSAALGLVLILTSMTGCDGSSTEAQPVPTNVPTTAAPSVTGSAIASAAPASKSVDSAAALKKAVKAYSDAFLTGKVAESRALLSKRCKDRVGSAAWQGIVAGAGQQYGTALPIKTYRAQVSGNLARVTYTYDVAEINQDSEPWVREAGHWHEDDC
jgi:hypothetical protein